MGGLLYLIPSDKIEVKIPIRRIINHVGIDELVKAMYIIASKSVGSTEVSLILDVDREYGYSRVGANISLAMQKTLVQLRKAKRVSIVERKAVADKNIA